MWRFSVPMWLAVCLTAAAGASAEKPANLIHNPDFALDADGDGVPDGWRVSGDANVVQTLSVARDEQGRPYLRLQATAFKAASLASHVMLCQMDIPIERGRYYRLAFRARGEGPSDDLVQIGMRDTRTGRASASTDLRPDIRLEALRVHVPRPAGLPDRQPAPVLVQFGRHALDGRRRASICRAAVSRAGHGYRARHERQSRSQREPRVRRLRLGLRRLATARFTGAAA